MARQRCTGDIERSDSTEHPDLGVDKLIAGLAARQHGVVARGQLLDLGISQARIDGRRRRAQLHPLHRGVYAVGHCVIGPEGRWLAAVLASGEGAVLSHRSAAALWRLTPRFDHAVEITRIEGWRSLSRVSAHRGPLPGDEVEVIDGIPVTSVSRTLLDLASLALSRRTFNPRQLEQALNEGRRSAPDQPSVDPRPSAALPTAARLGASAGPA